METAMTSGREIFAPRTIAQARTRRAKRARRSISVAIGKIVRGLRTIGQRMARDWQYQRELGLLMHADDRMLADIGLTRHDVIAAAQQQRSWLRRHDALRAAGLRRAEAMATARLRGNALAHLEAPSLVPALPRVMETSNFR
jgi:uncharacterized protein YjiS (DUF1127 family)